MSVEPKDGLTNGSAAAAVLAAGVGCLALAVLAFAGDKSAAIKVGLNFYKPTGPLSGVTTLALVVWVVVWVILEVRWRSKTVAAGRVAGIGLGLLLTFPPVVDLF